MHVPLRPPDATASETAQRIFSAGASLLRRLEEGRAIDARALRDAMTAAFSGTDADGAWLWKQAYEASEVATTLLLRRFGPAMIARAASPAGVLPLIARIALLEPPPDAPRRRAATLPAVLDAARDRLVRRRLRQA